MISVNHKKMLGSAGIKFPRAVLVTISQSICLSVCQSFLYALLLVCIPSRGIVFLIR